MSDLFENKAGDWDLRPVPAQISAGVGEAIQASVSLSPDLEVMDFGAGTGLICFQLAPSVAKVVAVDVSPAMLDKLAAKAVGSDHIQTRCQDILEQPLDESFDLIVSAMAMHHVQDTDQLFRAFADHLKPEGRVALADLDTEDGSFHQSGNEGVFHFGFDRDTLTKRMHAAGFTDVAFTTACEIPKENHSYSVFLMTATKAA